MQARSATEAYELLKNGYSGCWSSSGGGGGTNKESSRSSSQKQKESRSSSSGNNNVFEEEDWKKGYPWDLSDFGGNGGS